jgi:hypothetical protein
MQVLIHVSARIQLLMSGAFGICEQAILCMMRRFRGDPGEAYSGESHAQRRSSACSHICRFRFDDCFGCEEEDGEARRRPGDSGPTEQCGVLRRCVAPMGANGVDVRPGEGKGKKEEVGLAPRRKIA